MRIYHNWSNAERLDLLLVCADETIEKDWVKRAEAMVKRYVGQKSAHYFTAKTCHSEFERILSSPCPGVEPNTSGQYSFSHKVLIEKWIAHFEEEIEKEQKRRTELALIEMRRYTSYIEKIMADKMSLEDMERLLEQLRMEDPNKEENTQFRRVVSTYSNRLLHLWKQGNRKKEIDVGQLSPTKAVKVEEVPVKVDEKIEQNETVENDEEPKADKLISSPIRSVADVLKDAVPIFVEPIPPEKIDQKIEVEKSIEEVKEDVKEARMVEKARRSRVSRGSKSTDSVESEVKKPKMNVTRLRKREESEEKKPVEPIETQVPSNSKEVECQTSVSISRNQALAVTDRRKSSASAKKVQKRGEVKTIASTPSTTEKFCHVACQTSRVEFDKDDVVTLNYEFRNKYHVETIQLDRRKRHEKKVKDEETMAEISYEKEDEVEELTKRAAKAESKREMVLVIDTEESVANALIQKGYNVVLNEGTSSAETPTKRMRKDERFREEMTNMKYQLNNMMRTMMEHKHSGIFTHPVMEKDAPGYSVAVKKRMDLGTLRKEVESGQVQSKVSFLLKSYTMFANAIMFNSTGHDVNNYALSMVKDSLFDAAMVGIDDSKKLKNECLLESLQNDDRKGLPRRSKMDDSRSSQRGASVQPEQPLNLGVPGNKRTIYAKKQSQIVRRVSQK